MHLNSWLQFMLPLACKLHTRAWKVMTNTMTRLKYFLEFVNEKNRLVLERMIKAAC
jgi:hypothetical protein